MLEIKELMTFKIFKNVKEEELKYLFENLKFEIKNFKKEDVLFFRNEKLDGLFLIIDGSLSAEMLKDNGEITKIENLLKGEMIASAFIFGDNNILPVDLIALEKGKIIYIDKKNLLKAFNLNEKILVNFLNEISNRTQFLSNRIWSHFNNKTIKEKVMDYILENKKEDKIVFKHSINELSERFGVSRPALSRVISEFVKNGILERNGKNKFILKK
ncbi:MULTISPECIES: Crp/Fnr family transcriptional regulator [Cetobacterium]|uniref:Crp/Fnr family transcriptional regulator n=1 Tax=Candidatus Cetobacterium colombiensis TaxID=3073100 RepID=A0ABU4WAZ8_9FUSO|nr:Crp/Fnr family transcriptional regulator [Candidatus Cetobacterium colombiensis]MDX8336723.1 Crp/Fnr family transcriptional regulator [Candidatus Cetobacterium colombiensis]